MGPADFKKYFGFLKFDTKSFQKLHIYVEDFVGAQLIDVSERSMKAMLTNEIKKSANFFNVVSNSPELVTKVPIVIKLDMQWLQRGFFSPSGTIHAIGGLTNGIIGTKLLINKCTICAKFKASSDKLEATIRQCESKTSPCFKCVDICYTKQKMFDVEKNSFI